MRRIFASKDPSLRMEIRDEPQIYDRIPTQKKWEPRFLWAFSPKKALKISLAIFFDRRFGSSEKKINTLSL